MHKVENKTTLRVVGLLINGLISILAAFSLIICIFFMISAIFYTFGLAPWFIVIFVTIISGLELAGSIATFFPVISDGPYSALLNIPLYAVDLTICLVFGAFIHQGFKNRMLELGRVIKMVPVILVTLRYLGLAWTDRNFCLKRYIAPVRSDTKSKFLFPDLNECEQAAVIPATTDEENNEE